MTEIGLLECEVGWAFPKHMALKHCAVGLRGSDSARAVESCASAVCSPLAMGGSPCKVLGLQPVV